MASLKGLPPLPKSLSGLLSFSSAQWKEMERIHTMRTIIQEDLSRSQQEHCCSVETATSNNKLMPGQVQKSSGRKTSTLDTQLAVLRKEMVGLRQLDMSLLCQLWSLNESLLEYKHLLHDMRMQTSSIECMSPGWDNSSGDEMMMMQEEDDDVEGRLRHHRSSSNKLCLVQEADDLSQCSSSASDSSLEFGDI